ncbi:hypothetical protein [Rhizobium binae]|uniref:hypothetical protein n=1 Tax=Rhizobium binae TaxID=1138190 RepID=UPI003DA9F50E
MSDVLLELEGLLPRIPQAVTHQKVSHQIDRLLEKFSDFGSTRTRLSALLDISVLIDFDDEHVVEMKAASQDAAAALLKTADEASILRAEEAYQEFKTAIGLAERFLRNHWKLVVSRDYAPFSTIGRLLKQFGDTSDIGNRMEALGARADQSINIAIIAELRDTIRTLGEERSKLEAEKAAMTKNSEVDDFLNKLASGDATLASVTPTVHQWLSDHGALEDLAVRPRENRGTYF